uniref:prolyl 4-hydroxylase subunit alpha-1-like n=1 Tax=Myxine glutinosa TaxID=7769 RepID=UPI00358E9E64
MVSRILFCILLVTWPGLVPSEIFTSIGEMAELRLAERELVTSLEQLIAQEKERLTKIQRWVDSIQESKSSTTNLDAEAFVGHPAQAFLLIHRLGHAWPNMASLLAHNYTHEFLSSLSANREIFPSDEDRLGAAKALIRLQDTYRLPPPSLAAGEIPGGLWMSQLSLDDSFALTRVAYVEGDWYHTETWAAQALRQLQAGETGSVTEVDILDHLSYAVYRRGDIHRAHSLTMQLLKLDPQNVRAQNNLVHFMAALGDATKGHAEGRTWPTTGIRSEIPWSRRSGRRKHFRTSYEQLCRGEGANLTERRRAKLVCRYVGGSPSSHPLLVIAPFREEMEWDSPRIVRYHDVISEAEASRVMKLAKPRLNRATVHDPLTGELTVAQYRVSKSAWLREEHDWIVKKLNRRIETITGLNVDTAEELQVANYGLAGQYEPHFDFGSDNEPDAFEELGTGNRIATFLFYMSDVTAGGYTVFTDLHAVVKPLKGSAVFWYNLFPNGKGDYRTRHAGCPVLMGSKWVSNKWLHERGQEFRRRCDLSPFAE